MPLLPGTPLAPSTDAVKAAWLLLDESWVAQNASLDTSGHWLVRTDGADPDSEEDGLTAFRSEFWGMSTYLIENPPAPYNINNDGTVEMDRDYDCLPDLWEYRYAFNLRHWQDPWLDSDADAQFNQNEFNHGTHPRLADSDGDGFSNGDEPSRSISSRMAMSSLV